MPASRGNSKTGRADPAKLAEWQAEKFTALRRHRDLVTIVDDELPGDVLADLDETESALERLRRA